MSPAVIVAAHEVAYSRHPNVGLTTSRLIASAVRGVLKRAGIDHRSIDGLGVSSFTLGPDHAIDVAWKMGLRLRWLVQDPHGGASGVNLLQLATRAIEAGDAECIVLVAADHLDRSAADNLHENYNSVTRDHLAPMGAGGPNALFAMLTQRHMRARDLHPTDYAQISISQRRWASRNPLAVYRDPMTLDDYLASPMVFEPLRRYDCVPEVSGADAIVIMSSQRARGRAQVVPISFGSACNVDQQEGEGFATGHERFRETLWDRAGVGPSEMDVIGVYDDYPVMVVAQLEGLGMIPDGDVKRFLHSTLAEGDMPLNTSGGQLSAGQAGAAGGMHFLVEAVEQLLGTAGGRQVPLARRALVSGYGMVLYRFGSMANAVVLEARS